MNTAFVLDEWVPALRSGQYAQGQGRLRTPDNRFCCLGVACDLLVQQGLLPGWTSNAEGNGLGFPMGMLGLSDNVNAGTLPQRAQAHLNVMSNWGPPVAHAVSPHLPELNDLGATFAEIADALEAAALAELRDTGRSQAADAYLAARVP